MSEKCTKCKEETNGDIRYLRMKCLYDMNELNIPFEEDQGLFIIGVCKRCRGDWMQAIENWFNEPVKEDSDSATVPVRIKGATVMMTLDEYAIHEEARK